VVIELVVLFRIQGLEQGRRGVASEIRPHLVDFVQDDDRIARSGRAQGLDDATGEGAHVGPAVSSDFCFVPDSTQGGPVELPPQGPGHRAAQ